MNNNQLHSTSCLVNGKPPSDQANGRRVSYDGDDLIKSVTFNEAVTVQPIPEVASQMSPTDLGLLYYSTEDVSMFRSEAKQICIRAVRRARSEATDSGLICQQQITALLRTDSNLRGMERYMDPERNRNKAAVISSVLGHQKLFLKTTLPKNKTGESLAEVYSRLSNWSLMNALDTARSDFYQAYNQEDFQMQASFASRGLQNCSSKTTSSSSGALKDCSHETARAICSTGIETPITIKPFPKPIRKRKRC